MKRATAIIISVMILCCGCGKSKKEVKEPDSWRVVSMYDLTEENKNGMFSANDGERLDFIDFSTMEQAPVCGDPACRHTEAEGCSAYGKSNHPFIHNEKLCYFKQTDLYLEDDIYKMDTQLWQCDIDGGNEKELAEFKGLIYQNYGRMIVKDDDIYMCMTSQTFDKDFVEEEPSVRLVSYNFKSGKTSDHGEVVSGYSCGTWVYGVWDNKIVFSCSKAKNNIPYMQRVEEYAKENNLSDEDALAQFQDEYDTACMEFDLDSKSVKEYSEPEPLAISQDYYFYTDGSDLKYIYSDGEEKINGITNAENIDPMNDYAVIQSDEGISLFNYENRGITKLSLGEGQSVCGISGKDVIIQNLSSDGEISYDKKAISSLEG